MLSEQESVMITVSHSGAYPPCASWTVTPLYGRQKELVLVKEQVGAPLQFSIKCIQTYSSFLQIR